MASVKAVQHGAPRVSWRQTVLAATVPQLSVYALGQVIYGINVAPIALGINMAIAFALLAWMRMSVRGSVALWVMGIMAALAFHFLHVIKIAFFGEPITAADISAGLALLDILKGWRKVVALACIAAVVAMFCWSVWPRKGGVRYLVGAAITSLLLVSMIVWAAGWGLFPAGNKLSLFYKAGGVFFMVADAQHYRRENLDLPSYKQIAQMTSNIGQTSAMASSDFKRRNVHIFLLEAGWDVLQLDGYRFSEDPWDSRFRAMWLQGGRTHALSPVFGGATANAEFELLCGMPAGNNAIIFQERLRNDVPCIPRVLRASGYRTAAFHPYKQQFWSRDGAYRLIGFETFYAEQAFERDDLDGGFLSDSSLVRQVKRLEDENNDSRPLFSYVVTLSSHYPYERNISSRPDTVRVQPYLMLVQNYANGIRYSTAAIMDAVDAIRASDPDAVIAIIGDHAPVLGSSPNPYQESGLSLPGLLSGKTGDQKHLSLLKTPLILVDGIRGPVKIGDVPMRQVPTLILGLLGEEGPRLPIANWEVRQKEPWSSHVFLGRLFIRGQDGSWRACDPGEQECSVALEQQKELEILRRDLVRGYRYSARTLGANNLMAPSKMSIPVGSCKFPVEDWGPKEIIEGQSFFVQPDGSSAFWIKLAGGVQGEPALSVADSRADLLFAANMASASFQNPPFVAKPGHYPVTWGCGNKTEGRIGTLAVMPRLKTEPVATLKYSIESESSNTCRAKVLDWGPRAFVVGRPFYQQADGSSTYWVKVSSDSQDFSLSLQGVPIQTVRSNDTLSFTHSPVIEKEGSRLGVLNFQLSCGKRTEAAFQIRVTRP